MKDQNPNIPDVMEQCVTERLLQTLLIGQQRIEANLLLVTTMIETQNARMLGASQLSMQESSVEVQPQPVLPTQNSRDQQQQQEQLQPQQQQQQQQQQQHPNVEGRAYFDVREGQGATCCRNERDEQTTCATMVGKKLSSPSFEDAVAAKSRMITNAYMRFMDWSCDVATVESLGTSDGDGEPAAGHSIFEPVATSSGDGKLPEKRRSGHERWRACRKVWRKIDKLTQSPLYYVALAIVTVLDALCLVVVQEITGHQQGQHYGLPGPFKVDIEIVDAIEEVVRHIQFITTWVFTVDLVVRFCARPRRFHTSLWNYLDTILVFCALAEVVQKQLATVTPMGFLRVVRVFRLLRALRLVRMLEEFRELRILLHTVIYSVAALCWSFVMLIAIQVVCALFLCTFLQPVLEADDTNEEDREFVWEYFGTFGRSVWTLFELQFGGWQKLVRPVIMRIQPALILFFVPYVLFVTFAVMKIVTALFLKTTIAVAAREKEEHRQKEAKNTCETVKGVLMEMQGVDLNSDGMLDRSEFDKVLQLPAVQAWYRSMGVSEFALNAVHDMLERPDGRIQMEEFIVGMLQLYGGTGSALEPAALLYETHKLALWGRSVAMQQELHSAKFADLEALLGTLLNHMTKDASDFRPPVQLFPTTPTQELGTLSSSPQLQALGSEAGQLRNDVELFVAFRCEDNEHAKVNL